jgi:ABC-type spermidine/putrescine transport system permease subunit I
VEAGLTTTPSEHAATGGPQAAGRRRTYAPRVNAGILVLPALIFMCIFYIWPLANVVVRSVTEPQVGLQNFERFAATSYVVTATIRTFEVAAIVTLIVLVIGYAYAYLLTVAPRVVAGVLLVAVLLPFWSSFLVRTYAWTVLLRDTGIINGILMNLGLISEPLPLIRSTLGTAIGMTHILLPAMTLPIWASMLRVDPELPRAAASLGAGPMTSFRTVFFPLTLPGVIGGSLLVFVMGIGFYITPALLGGPKDMMISMAVVMEVQRLNWGFGSAISVVLLVATFAILAVAARVVRLPGLLGVDQL